MDGVSSAKVAIVFDPPWTQDMMSEAVSLRRIPMSEQTRGIAILGSTGSIGTQALE